MNGSSSSSSNKELMQQNERASSIACSSKTPPNHHQSLPNQGIATPHQKSMARIQAATPASQFLFFCLIIFIINLLGYYHFILRKNDKFSLRFFYIISYNKINIKKV